MKRGTRIAFHYIIEEHSKLIKAILHREKKALGEYHEAIKLRETIAGINNENSKKLLQGMSPLPNSIEDGYEAIVVKKWIGILSTYPVMITDWHWENNTWSKFFSQPNSVAQKYAALQVFEYESKIICELWSKGELLKDWSFEAGMGSKYGEQTTFISSFANGEISNDWLQHVPTNLKVEDLANVPLLLPNDWKEKWHVVKQTELVFCCD